MRVILGVIYAGNHFMGNSVKLAMGGEMNGDFTGIDLTWVCRRIGPWAPKKEARDAQLDSGYRSFVYFQTNPYDMWGYYILCSEIICWGIMWYDMTDYDGVGRSYLCVMFFINKYIYSICIYYINIYTVYIYVYIYIYMYIYICVCVCARWLPTQLEFPAARSAHTIATLRKHIYGYGRGMSR